MRAHIKKIVFGYSVKMTQTDKDEFSVAIFLLCIRDRDIEIVVTKLRIYLPVPKRTSHQGFFSKNK